MLLQPNISMVNSDADLLRGGEINHEDWLGNRRDLRRRRTGPTRAAPARVPPDAGPQAHDIVRVDDYDDEIYYSVGDSSPCVEENSQSGRRGDASEECENCTKRLWQEKQAYHITLFLFLLAFRIGNAVLLRTFFQPDEYWQSQEIAHRIVFGYGYQTWEWRASPESMIKESAGSQQRPTLQELADGPIRSVTHALFFVPGYWVVKVLGMDSTFLLTLAPRITQAFFAAMSDLFMFKLSKRIISSRAAYIGLLLSLTSTYGLYTSVRTFSNTMEAAFTTVGTYFWPSEVEGPDFSRPDARDCRKCNPLALRYRKHLLYVRLSLFCVATAFVIRPTNAIIWAYVLFRWIPLRMKRSATPSQAIESVLTIGFVLLDAVWIGTAVLAASILVDSIFYGHLVLTPLSFLNRNVLQSVSIFYGANPWHWYLSQGIPVLCFTTLPFVLEGCYIALRRIKMRRAMAEYPTKVALKALAETLVFVTFAFSLLGHKEFRFLQPLLPMFHVLGGYALSRRRWGLDERAQAERGSLVERSRGPSNVEAEKPLLERLSDASNQHWQGIRAAWHQIGTHRWPAKALLLAQLPFALYLVVFHCAGQEQITRDLRKIHFDQRVKMEASSANTWFGSTKSGKGATRERASGPIHSVAFLMPCHSTPWQSSLHLPELEEYASGNSTSSDAHASPKRTSGDHGRAWFITCDPPRTREEVERLHATSEGATGYKDVSDVFYENPVGFLQTRFADKVDPSFPPLLESLRAEEAGGEHQNKIPWPSHLVTFEALHGQTSPPGRISSKGGFAGAWTRSPITVEKVLKERGYRIVHTRWNSLKHEDPRRDGKVVVWQWIAGSR